MTKKRSVSFVLTLVMLLTFISLLTSCVSSEEIPIPTAKEDVYIYDENNIIDDDVEKKLNLWLVELEKKTTAEFAVITTDSLRDYEIEEYANKIFNSLGIGKKEKDNGVLLLISKPDNRVRLEIGRGLEGCLNDSKCGRILDNYFVPYREKDEYTKATQLTVNAVLNEICKEYNVDINGLEENLPEAEESMDWSLLLVIILTLVAVAIVIAILAPDNSSGGGFGGSFGGGFSGGSGFGGGFSGGGGSSR